jgi:hypothetical protein
MQFTTALITFALAAAGVSAAPNPAAALETRQTPGLVYIRFFANNSCTGDWIEDDVFFDDGTGTCRVEPFTRAYGSFRVETNEATRSCKYPFVSFVRGDGYEKAWCAHWLTR